jgi:branched-subunit amino acid transport protein
MTRFSFIVLLDRITVPVWFQRGLRFVPGAVLSAIILPELASNNTKLDLSLHNPQLFAGLLAVLVAWRTRNVLLTIVVGMTSLLMLKFLMGS